MRAKTRFRAVLFDLGWTLMKNLDPPAVYKRILEAYDVKVSLDRIAEAHNASMKKHDSEEMARLGQEYWVKWNLKVLDKLGIKQKREFYARKIDELWWEYSELELYPDAIETLTQLRIRKIKTGIVTNGLERDYGQILQKLDLESYFDVVVGVDSCGKAKPDKEIFLYAVNRLNVHSDETIFIGDSVKFDYEGAKKAGLKPLLIDREGKVTVSTDVLRSLTSVLDYV
jgi:putative hydrolase of the HAD superfamily